MWRKAKDNFLMIKSGLDRWMGEEGQKFLKEIGVRKGQTVLDFGCGEGHYTIPTSKVVGKSGKIYALDKNEDILDMLKISVNQASLRNIEIINGNSRMPIKSESIDFVLCYDVIHYVNKKERKEIYGEVYRVLKEGGLFSVYPKHLRGDDPIMELAEVGLENIVKEIEESCFILKNKILKRLIHDDHYNEGLILNFRKGG